MNRLFGKSLPLLLAILSTCSYGQEVTAQGRSWPVNYGYTPMRRSPPLRGFIVLTNGDTLEGYIKVFAFYDYYPILDTGTNKVQDIYFSDIGSMRISRESACKEQGLIKNSRSASVLLKTYTIYESDEVVLI